MTRQGRVGGDGWSTALSSSSRCRKFKGSWANRENTMSTQQRRDHNDNDDDQEPWEGKGMGGETMAKNQAMRSDEGGGNVV